jgi:hypothetical protein
MAEMELRAELAKAARGEVRDAHARAAWLR